jgi:hypothetical protein
VTTPIFQPERTLKFPRDVGRLTDMRSLLPTLCALAVFSSMLACRKSPPPAAVDRAESIPEAGFTSVADESSENVRIAIAPGPASAKVHCPEPRASRVHTRVVNDTLVVTHDEDDSIHLYVNEAPCEVRVSMPKLLAVTTRGAGDVYIDGSADGLAKIQTTGAGDVTVEAARTPALEIDTTAAGDVTIAGLTATAVRTKIAGSGNVTLNGEAKALAVVTTGSGDLDAHGLKVTTGDVHASGSGDVRMHASERVQIDSTGSSDVRVSGHPAAKEVAMRGSGDVHWD